MAKTKPKKKLKLQTYITYAKRILLILSFPIWYPFAIIGWLCEQDLLGPTILIGIILTIAGFGIWLETGKSTKYTPCQTVYIRYSNQPALIVDEYKSGRYGDTGNARILLTVNGKPEIRQIEATNISSEPWTEIITTAPTTIPTSR